MRKIPLTPDQKEIVRLNYEGDEKFISAVRKVLIINFLAGFSFLVSFSVSLNWECWELIFKIPFVITTIIVLIMLVLSERTVKPFFDRRTILIFLKRLDKFPLYIKTRSEHSSNKTHLMASIFTFAFVIVAFFAFVREEAHKEVELYGTQTLLTFGQLDFYLLMISAFLTVYLYLSVVLVRRELNRTTQLIFEEEEFF